LTELLTAREAGDMLKVSDQTIRTMIKNGKIRGFKVGRSWRIKREEIDKLLQS
jgi:excisionase family DNA binding protein